MTVTAVNVKGGEGQVGMLVSATAPLQAAFVLRKDPANSHQTILEAEDGTITFDRNLRVVSSTTTHNSCSWGWCAVAAWNFLTDLPGLQQTQEFACDLCDDEDAAWTWDVTCPLCYATYISPALAAAVECLIDRCGWCDDTLDNNCGSPETRTACGADSANPGTYSIWRFTTNFTCLNPGSIDSGCVGTGTAGEGARLPRELDLQRNQHGLRGALHHLQPQLRAVRPLVGVYIPTASYTPATR
jgi:hypothetical protein